MNKLKIGLIGYGKMGKMIEKCAHELGHQVVVKVNERGFKFSSLEQADICIDFSHPEKLLENLETCGSANKNVVIGTTGWDIDKAKHVARKYDMGLLYSPNFSIGITQFLKIVREASKLLPGYEAAGWEAHHSEKVDSPSGTAKAIAQATCRNVEFASTRVGSIPGTHTLIFDSPVDTITLTHTARNREGFAVGAVKAAEWLHGKKGFYTMEDMLDDL